MCIIFVTIRANFSSHRIKNIWGFKYDPKTRRLILKRFKRFYQEGDGPWKLDSQIRVKDKESFDRALGPEYDRQKIIHIAKAKALQSDFNMRYNEVDCIDVTFEESSV